MQDELGKFVQDENIKKFTLELAVEINDDRRNVLTRLLTEASIGLLPSARSGMRVSA